MRRSYLVDAPCSMDLIGHKVLAGTCYGPAEYLSGRRKRFRFMTRAEMDRYYKKVDESKGFDVDGCPGRMSGRIVPLTPGLLDWPNAIEAARFAATYGCQGKRLLFVSLLKANLQTVCRYKFYVTFTANDIKDQGKIKTFRAIVYRDFFEPKFDVELFETVTPVEEQSTSPKASVQMAAKGKDFKAKRQTIGRPGSSLASTSRNAKDHPSKHSYRSRKYKSKRQTIERRGSALAGFRNFLAIIKWKNRSLTHSEAMTLASKKWKSLSIAGKKDFVST